MGESLTATSLPARLALRNTEHWLAVVLVGVGCAGRERVQREAVVHGSAEHARRDCGRRADGWDGSLDSDCHPGPVCVPVGGCGCDGPRVYHVADADCDFVCVWVCACDSCDWGVCCCWRVDVCRRVCPCRALCFVYDVRAVPVPCVDVRVPHVRAADCVYDCNHCGACLCRKVCGAGPCWAPW